MIREYPEDAAIITAMRADALLDQGDCEGCKIWQRVVKAINELGRKPASCEPRH
jgi:hypothetical protein